MLSVPINTAYPLCLVGGDVNTAVVTVEDLDGIAVGSWEGDRGADGLICVKIVLTEKGIYLAKARSKDHPKIIAATLLDSRGLQEEIKAITLGLLPKIQAATADIQQVDDGEALHIRQGDTAHVAFNLDPMPDDPVHFIICEIRDFGKSIILDGQTAKTDSAVTYTIPAGVTSQLLAGRTYGYELDRKSDDGTVQTLLTGAIELAKGTI